MNAGGGTLVIYLGIAMFPLSKFSKYGCCTRSCEAVSEFDVGKHRDSDPFFAPGECKNKSHQNFGEPADIVYCLLGCIENETSNLHYFAQAKSALPLPPDWLLAPLGGELDANSPADHVSFASVLR